MRTVRGHTLMVRLLVGFSRYTPTKTRFGMCNTGSGTLFVYASGGNGGSAGGDCANTSRLQGYVAGALISTNASNNPSYGKTAFISFAVPAGATYQITSYPAQNYSCGSGVFSVFGYQT